VSPDFLEFQKKLGTFLHRQAVEISPGSTRFLVLIQQELPGMPRADQQAVLEGLRDTGAEIEVAEIVWEDLIPGMGLSAEAYNDALSGVRPGSVISLVGVPMGSSLSAPGRNTPLVALLESAATGEILQSEGKFPTKWRMLRRSDTSRESEDPSTSFEQFSSP